MVSLKDFGVVNQQFGYNTGNEFLYCISSWMKQLRKEGQVFRFGNVTFALLCPYINDEESDQLFVEIRERFRQVWRIGAIQTNIAGSFGQMKCIDFDAEITNIMEILPFMMQLAKEKEDGIIEYDETIEQMFRERKGMLALLREAIEKRMFEVWYQPVYDCHKQRIVSAEALVRLRNYDGKIVRPDLFIPLAEESGMIADVGRFVWNEVCRFIGEHQDIAPEYISVNFSMQQFRSPKLYQQMEESLHKYHVPYEKMKIEITERDILQDMKYMEQQMKLLTEKGLRFFMDDFGTGYSNFYSVMSLPFEVIKLDKSLLNGLENSSRDRLIIQTLVEMFHNIGMKVIAEGIETEEQKNMVQNMGADYIQGFFYAKPMPEEQLVEFLTHSAKR